MVDDRGHPRHQTSRVTERRRKLDHNPSHVALDLVPAPVLVVTADGRVVFCNRAAQRLLGQRDGIRQRHDHYLAFADPNAQRAYDEVMGGRAGERGRANPSGEGVVFMATRTSGKSPYVVRVVPGGGVGSRRRVQPQPAVIFIADPAAECRLDAALLGTVYSMTAAEARLASALLSGSTLSEFSSATGLSPSTARTQLLNIFRKTGTSRQALLIKLLMSLPARE